MLRCAASWRKLSFKQPCASARSRPRCRTHRSPDPADPRDRVLAMCSRIERLAAFQPACIILLSGAPDPGQDDEGWLCAVSGLRQAATFARGLGVKIALEPIRKTARTLTPRLDQAARMLDEANANEYRADLRLLAPVGRPGRRRCHQPTRSTTGWCTSERPAGTDPQLGRPCTARRWEHRLHSRAAGSAGCRVPEMVRPRSLL